MWSTGQGNDEFMAKMIIAVSPREGFLKTGASEENHEEILQEGEQVPFELTRLLKSFYSFMLHNFIVTFK